MLRAGFTLIASLFFSLSPIMSPAAMADDDEPPHRVLVREDRFEIREYEAQILAEVDVRGSMSGASSRAFRPLAGYIFGGNTARTGGSDEIAMTTPVTQTRSQDIAMTTPVTQTAAGADIWRVAFIMPPEWTMDSLPIPDDARVMLREQPARRMAAIRFSGGPSEQRFMRREAELRAWLDAQGEEVIGEPVYARYDPPWVPVFMRRNEVMIELASEGT